MVRSKKAIEKDKIVQLVHAKNALLKVAIQARDYLDGFEYIESVGEGIIEALYETISMVERKA